MLRRYELRRKTLMCFAVERSLDWAHANLVAWNAPLAEADPGVIVRPRVSADVTRSLAGILTVVILQHQLDALEQRRVPIDATSPGQPMYQNGL